MIRKLLSFIVFLIVLVWVISYSVPLLLALITAILLEPVVQFGMRVLQMKRIYSVISALALMVILFIGAGYWAGTLLVVQTVEFAHILPDVAKQTMVWGEKYFWMWQQYYTSLPGQTENAIQQVLLSLQNSAANAGTAMTKWILGLIASIPTFLLVSVVYFLSLFFISLDYPALRLRFLRMFTHSAREKVELVLSQLSRAFVGFIGAQLILSMITYFISLIGLMVFQVNYALILSLIIVIVDILPIFGAGLILFPWTLYSWTTGDNRLAIELIILFSVITIVRRIVEPKVLGSRLGISALATLASMYIGFAVIGFFGLILGPAVIIVIQSLRKAGFLQLKFDF